MESARLTSSLLSRSACSARREALSCLLLLALLTPRAGAHSVCTCSCCAFARPDNRSCAPVALAPSVLSSCFLCSVGYCASIYPQACASSPTQGAAHHLGGHNMYLCESDDDDDAKGSKWLSGVPPIAFFVLVATICVGACRRCSRSRGNVQMATPYVAYDEQRAYHPAACPAAYPAAYPATDFSVPTAFAAGTATGYAMASHHNSHHHHRHHDSASSGSFSSSHNNHHVTTSGGF